MIQPYEIVIQLDPTEIFTETSIKHDNVYYVKQDKAYYEKIEYNLNSIIINGQRNSHKKINLQDCLLTRASQFQFSILKALIYYYLKWGTFKLVSIQMFLKDEEGNRNSDGIKYTKEKLNQNFYNDIQTNEKWHNVKLDHIFNVYNVKNDWIVAFVYYLASYNNPVERFGNSWKCLNHIIDVVCSDVDRDRDKVEKILEEIEDTLDNEKIAEKSKQFIYNMKDSRLIKWATSNKYKIASSMDITGYEDYQDSYVIEKIYNALTKVYNGARIEKSDKKKFNEKYQKSLSKQSNKFDFLKIFLRYCRYLRNKYFHGEYSIENIILKSNEAMNELNAASDILQLLDKDLLDTIYFEPLLENQGYYKGKEKE